MNIPNLPSLLIWYVWIFVIGIVFLPLTKRLFSSFFDKGYLFSKMLGLAIISYTAYVLGTLYLLPFSHPTLLFILFIWAVILYTPLLFSRTLQSLFQKKKNSLFTLGSILLEEGIFLLAFLFWSYIRSFSPDVHGLEKYMDFGFINSILRTEYFPPKDMWFTPYSINYYYFGHLYTAVLTKLSNIPSGITFNLMIATIFAWCFSFSLSIGSNLIYSLKEKLLSFSRPKTLLSGIISAFLVSMSGNLHSLYLLFLPYINEKPVPFWQLTFAPQTFPNSYWYPNATRFIFNTIHEFPIYSWVVSDLHGHVLDIPLVLVTLALLFSYVKTPVQAREIKENKISLWKKMKQLLLQKETTVLISIGFMLGLMYMTNAWDAIIYLFVSVSVLFLKILLPFLQKQSVSNAFLLFCKSPLLLKRFLFQSVFLLLTLLLVSLPFSIFLTPPVSGIGVLCAPSFLTSLGHFGPFLFEPEHCQHSPFWQLLILYGSFIFFSTSFVLFLSTLKKKSPTDFFVLLLIIVSFFLIVAPEFIYLKDIYPAHYRANTMFKLVFQAFIMLSLVSAYTITRVLTTEVTFTRKSIPGYGIFMVGTVVILALTMTYPYMAISSYYGNLKTQYPLDGTKYLNILYPSDTAAIAWINSTIKGQPVILEAQGDSYTDYGRVSTNTGLPTVLGWTVHEWLWRGGYDIPAPRIEEIKKMYESVDIGETETLLKKYKVAYVFIGDLEKQKYPAIQEMKFEEFGRIVYQNGNTKIYKISL